MGDHRQGILRIFGETHHEDGDVSATCVESRMQTMRALLQLRPTDLFFEGFAGTGLPELRPAAHARIRDLFLRGTDEEQRSAFADPRLWVGMAYYGFSGAAVRLHVTESEEINNDVYRRLDAGMPYEAVVPAATLLREQFALHRIEQFLRTHPGAEVAMIYGANHDFLPHIVRSSHAGGFNPEVHWYNTSATPMQDIQACRLQLAHILRGHARESV